MLKKKKTIKKDILSKKFTLNKNTKRPRGRNPKNTIWDYQIGEWKLDINNVKLNCNNNNRCFKYKRIDFLNKSLNLDGKWGLSNLRDSNDNVIYEAGFLDRKNYYTIYHKKILNHSKLFVKNYECVNFEKLNIKLKPFIPNSGKYILICGQVYTDPVLKGFKKDSYKEWLISKIKLFINNRYLVMFRKHPFESDEIFIDSPFFKLSKNKKIEDDIKNAIVTVAFCSTSLIDSIIMGVPIIGYSKLSLVSDFFSNQDSFLKSGKLFFPSDNERYKKMCFLANNQFHRSQLPSKEFLLKLNKSTRKG